MDIRVVDASGSVDNRAAANFPPLETSGQALEGVSGEWTYTEFPDTECRDGSPAGVAVNFGSASRKLMIFLEGGGRCVDFQTCLINPPNVEAGGIVRLLSASAGVLDRSKPENPVRDWNFVYIPYCTGDFHGGANPNANVPDVGAQKFVGHLNTERFLDRIVPTFRDATDVLLTGISAGGSGAGYNAVLVQRAFSTVKVKTIIDSGPPLSTAAFPECLQDRHRSLWGLDETVLAECGAACPNGSDYSLDFGLFLAEAFRDRPWGLIETTEDFAERTLFGIGANDCTGVIDILNPGIPAATFRDDILAFREQVMPFRNFGTFYLEGDQHTWLGLDDFYAARAGGVALVDWFAKIVNGEEPGHVGP